MKFREGPDIMRWGERGDGNFKVSEAYKVISKGNNEENLGN
jgi:hypothetical protein